ncbi:MAG: nucleotidyl transferase AbiEii/AbiGii toxin family protein [Paludibacter sp.]|nr:nucleotidyl transferase AbiEii/AbiGii toxin family protein [Paludibacter sp.]
MTDAARDLLEKIKDDPLFHKHEFRFVGGTALSYHIGHRISEDLDFAFALPLPVFDIKSFAMKYRGSLIPDPRASAFMINSGIDFDTRFLRYMIDGVKVEFFFPEDPFSQMCLSGECTAYNESNVAILNLIDISKMKVKALMDRVKIRDLYDVSEIFERGILTEVDFFAAVYDYKQKDETWVLDRIDTIKEQKDDEGLYFADNRVPPTFEELRLSLYDRLDSFLKTQLLESDKAIVNYFNDFVRKTTRAK